MKRFRKFHPTLNPSEIGAGACYFHDGQILDIGFHHLGAVGLQRLDLQVDRVGNIYKNMGLEILRGGPLIKEHIANIARGRHYCLGKMPVVLVGVVREITENKIRLHFFDNILDFTDKLFVHRKMRVGISAPVDLFGTQDF